MKRRFFTLDVFTRDRFAGNPLAVVLDSSGLDDRAMQTIAREFNLSETVFVFGAAKPVHRASIRIFTTVRELPFAGHPIVGTATLLRLLDGGEDERALTLEVKVGDVHCRTKIHDASLGYAAFDLARLPEPSESAADEEALASALGLTPEDIGLAIGRWSAGVPYLLVPVASRDALTRAHPDMRHWDKVCSSMDDAAVYVFFPQEKLRIHARMFGPHVGIHEDPATGSAVAALAGAIARDSGLGDGDHTMQIEQGTDMGRRSDIELTLRIESGALKRATIAGHAVVVSEGSIEA